MILAVSPYLDDFINHFRGSKKPSLSVLWWNNRIFTVRLATISVSFFVHFGVSSCQHELRKSPTSMDAMAFRRDSYIDWIRKCGYSATLFQLIKLFIQVGVSRQLTGFGMSLYVNSS
jgi:hypothetical protein